MACRRASPLQRVYDKEDPGPSQVGMVVPLIHTRPAGEGGHGTNNLLTGNL